MEKVNGQNILSLFENKDFVKVCAPMVRYSKLQFRNLVRKYNCDLCFTPMILADSFCKSSKARYNEFTTNLSDIPLIAQFAANTVYDFVGAAYLVSPFCNGVDLNCGCPQRWAKQQGLGCVMLENPELIYDIVRQCRNQINKPFNVSIKMRILKNVAKTVDICRNLEKCGVSFLTVHSRTADHNCGEINKEALKLINENVAVPVIANGGVKNLQDCRDLHEDTKCKGIMVANGILTNPSLFTGTNRTTTECIQDWLNICYNSILTLDSYNIQKDKNLHIFPKKPSNLTFQCFHHHLVFMLEKVLTKQQKKIFNNLQTFEDTLQFIETNLELKPQLFDEATFLKYNLMNLNYEGRFDVYENLKSENKETSNAFWSDYSSEGKYFLNKVNSSPDDDLSDIFKEI